MKKPVLTVIGAGASGMAAAIEAAAYAESNRTDAEIILYERLPKPGKKILATGNGRCNIMNTDADLSKYSGDKKFISSVFEDFSPDSNILFFEKMGLRLAEEDSGRLYPMSFQASGVLDALRFEAQRLGVNIICDTKIESVEKQNNGFLLNDSLFTDALIVAGGGQSAAVQGSDGSCFDLLASLGIKISPVFPSLVPIVLKKKNKGVKGVRSYSEILIIENGRVISEAVGELQYTDYGLSGIPSMEASRAVSEHFALHKKGKIAVSVNSLPDFTQEEIFDYIYTRKRANPQLLCEDLLSGVMPKKLGIAKLNTACISPAEPLSALTKNKIAELTEIINSEIFEISGVLGFDNSQVTAGGAKTEQFGEKNLMAKKIKGLFACGEVLNVDARCGGYNLLWAWSSGRCAGLHAMKYLSETMNHA